MVRPFSRGLAASQEEVGLALRVCPIMLNSFQTPLYGSALLH